VYIAIFGYSYNNNPFRESVQKAPKSQSVIDASVKGKDAETVKKADAKKKRSCKANYNTVIIE